MTAGTRDDALDYADRAIELAERFDDAFALSNALISKGSVVARDDPATSVELIDRGRQIAMKAGLAITATRGWNNMALWLRFLGRSNEDRLAFVREGIAWAQAHGVEAGNIGYLRNLNASLLAQLGRFDEALTEYEWVLAHAAGLTLGPTAFLTLARDGVANVRDRVPELLRHAERVGESQVWVPDVAVAALILYADGRREEADPLVERYAIRTQAEEGVQLLATGPWHALTLGLAILAGRDDLIDVVGSRSDAPAPELVEGRRRAVAFARAFRQGRLADAGDELRTYWTMEDQTGVTSLGTPTLTVVASLAARERIATEATWRGPLLAMRAFAERAGARWWLELFPEPASS